MDCLPHIRAFPRTLHWKALLPKYLTKICLYTVKKVCGFPVPSRDVSNQTNYSRSGRVWLVSSPLGTGKSITRFLQCVTPVQLSKGLIVYCNSINCTVIICDCAWRKGGGKGSIMSLQFDQLSFFRRFTIRPQIDHFPWGRSTVRVVLWPLPNSII
jgi:hypothetical protein